MPRRRSAFALAHAAVTSIIGMLIPAEPAFGQSGGVEETRPPLPEFRPEVEPGLELPPVPAPAERDRLSAGVRVLARAFELVGNTVFSDDELAALTAPYAGRAITTEELLELRDSLTRHYVEAGFINSGAIIPDQSVDDGIIEILIVEGRLTEIEVAGVDSLRPSFIEDRIRLGAGPPLDVDVLRERIQLLLTDPAVERVAARLGPGQRPGESRLEIDVLEAPWYQAEVRVANDRSPAVGGERGEVTLSYTSIFGHSDPLRLQVGLAEGLRDFQGSYSVPLNPHDPRFFILGEVTDSEVVEEPFSAVDVQSRSWTVQAGFSVPVIKTLDDELRLDLGLERKRSVTSLLGRRFAFSEGVEDDGESNITALRFAQQFQHRTQEQVIALRSTESLGIGALGATINSGDTPDGQFFAWLGQAQYARRLLENGWQVNLRGDVQLTGEGLLPIERVAIGGIDTVRGYRENQLVLDNGWIVSAELRIPLGRLAIPGIAVTPESGGVQLVPFADAGGGWNVETPDPDERTIYSVGAGLRWRPHERMGLRLDVGVPLRDVPEPDDEDLQDFGIHFEVRTRFY